ncbi:hemolysin secretion protein D [Aeromonas salmonicida subsp. salmonicida]|uniref:HlyD family secretion protein n=1 Tax=Aeromonas salmonicida subsp. salmonicida 01-B526 TaxID=1076135 RepID=A0ABP2N2Q2_AERSS|nr:efflux RND transporter periplasmic adaptor subunit [Aeromonas salmonicida]AYO64044.1 efflux RND transporter periplasmic adaptor subunit [Aeromonas salmonicida subsp. salmonicida 01-B526]EHI53219.1 HlyD family secretion protein [Aeromonas salmonicida subsp. salmonicida 01-B526]OAH79378.1 efflux transporter periplasmic adaptor subunit [Aeromonas salmonicida subsp. salmonicida]OKA82921.1 efflux transporter periplasmic adaptor subunit [Aeromonas salmonicida subsp. salmonicida]OSM52963.1 hemolys
MNITPKQRKFALLALIPLAAITWLAWPNTTPDPVLSAPVTRQDVEQTVLASGVLQAIEQVDVGAQVSGQVTYLAVEAGQSVKQGDLLAEIDPLIAQNNLKTAEADLASRRAQLKIKQAQLKQNELAWRRQQQMFKQEASSRADLESAEAQLAVTRAELQSAQAEIENALIKVDRTKTELGYNRILAPMDGTVVSIVTRQGQTLAASQTVPTLLKLANLETMTVKAQISEADVTRVKAGMPVYFTLMGDADTRYHGTLRTVELAPTNINEQATSNAAVYYYALFDVPNPDHTLRVAMTTQVTIVLGERKQVLTIPQTALGKKLGENEYEVTLIKDDDQKETRRIKTGMKDDIKVEVVSGLTEQDKVKLGQSAPVNGPDVEMML